MSTDRFYADLPALREFSAFTSAELYRPLPEDWVIFITDIVRSTEAIAQGRYKDVNTLGAATIAAARNALGTLDVPFVFNGDGAVVAVPPSGCEPVRVALAGLQSRAREGFGLELRAGMIPVRDLAGQGFRVEVARLDLAFGRCIALFRGGGLTEADRQIKADPDRYSLGITHPPAPDLHGLSCRWQPIPSAHGRIVSLIVSASRASDERGIYREFMESLTSIFGGRLDDGNPVNVQEMSYRTLGEMLREERRYHPPALSRAYVMRALEIVFAWLVFRVGFRPGFIDAAKYASSMRTHADFQKFDDQIRMVIDCTPARAAQIAGLLDSLHRAGRVFYGMHESNESLMTCFVQSLGDGGHIHFIDGSDGGYAIAARRMKEQLENAEA